MFASYLSQAFHETLHYTVLYRAAGAPANAPPKKEKHEKQHTSGDHKGGKKKQQHAEKWNRDASKQFTHPWLLTSWPHVRTTNPRRAWTLAAAAAASRRQSPTLSAPAAVRVAVVAAAAAAAAAPAAVAVAPAAAGPTAVARPTRRTRARSPPAREMCSMLTPTAAAFHPAEDRAALSESKERKCVRCGRGFFVTDDGEYLTQERCVYHWGKLQAAGRGRAEYSCCKGRPTSRGCSVARLHVWVGVREGVNGPLDGFVRTRPRKSLPPDGNFGVYALDCEMCFTTHGLELAKVTVVAADGRLVLFSFVLCTDVVTILLVPASSVYAAGHIWSDTEKLTDLKHFFAGRCVILIAMMWSKGHETAGDVISLVATAVCFLLSLSGALLCCKCVSLGTVMFPDGAKEQQDNHTGGHLKNQTVLYENSLNIKTTYRFNSPFASAEFGYSDSIHIVRIKIIISAAFLKLRNNRSLLVWNTRDWTQKEHKNVRVNVELDHATLVRWSPDSKAMVVRRAADNALEVFRVARRADGLVGAITRAATFPKLHEEAVVGLGVACSGRFMLTCSEGTDLLISDIKGQPLARVDTYLMHTYTARVSPCGRFIAASGFAPDVKVWEVTFSKSGEFQSVNRAFELSGHSSGVFDVAFNSDTTRMATVSKDGTWMLFDTNVEFKKGEDPHLLMSQKYPLQTGSTAHLALSPTADVIVIGAGNQLHFYVTRTGELDRTIKNIFSVYHDAHIFA
ncbi:Transducin beta-like protein 2 [Gryllus bimaculatus]|nr:Transducin beta-like protein 2 [Gryllus bimaculatus]